MNFFSVDGSGSNMTKPPLDMASEIDGQNNINDYENKMEVFLAELIAIYGLDPSASIEDVVLSASNKGHSFDMIISKLALHYNLPANVSYEEILEASGKDKKAN
jgi:hypothetical protein